ncbi:hypothetical protein AN414_11230 [Serratia marcescens]|nr:hypothetical protein AN414_11230 [Serratia marcescens]
MEEVFGVAGGQDGTVIQAGGGDLGIRHAHRFTQKPIPCRQFRVLHRAQPIKRQYLPLELQFNRVRQFELEIPLALAVRHAGDAAEQFGQDNGAQIELVIVLFI